ncbi:type I restriction-modification enzyme R subunit C-terminal domain-containing protein [Archangium minus]|uniref:type I restriction-modification enzyme R subunit C-terminal domain-containing protein n=1 Tax=Archangium minus TaxID=83450 RepID=UPI0037C1A301
MLASRPWTPPQKKWLEQIGNQLTANVVLDRQSFDSGAFKDHGGWAAMDKALEGRLEQVLGELVDHVWSPAARCIPEGSMSFPLKGQWRQGVLAMSALLQTRGSTGFAFDSATSACRQNPGYCASVAGEQTVVPTTLRGAAEVACPASITFSPWRQLHFPIGLMF